MSFVSKYYFVHLCIDLSVFLYNLKCLMNSERCTMIIFLNKKSLCYARKVILIYPATPLKNYCILRTIVFNLIVDHINLYKHYEKHNK